ncbi:MAG: SHOCT domain-containing protein [Planctomycetota bacterium]
MRIATFVVGLVFLVAGTGLASPELTPERKAELEKKLAVLDEARAAGILTEEEYAQKKAAIEKELGREAPVLDEEAKKRLAALEKARDVGIITDEEYAKKKAAILADAKKKAAKPPKKPEPRGRKGKIYQHVVGFRFWYPEGWKVQRQDELLQLVPPDPAMSPEGPKELYLIGGESVAEDGITKPDDPRVAEYFDTQLRSLVPFLSRVGKTEAVKTPFGAGAEMVWEGKAPNGNVIRARVLCCILKQHGISLVSLGVKDVVQKRDLLVRQVFDSFGFGEGMRDKALVGKWSLLKTSGLTNNSPFETDWSRARAVADEKTTIELRADGTWTRVVDWHMIAISGGLTMESKDRDVTHGTWNAGNGKLILVSKGDVWEEYRYRVTGAELRLAGEKRGEIWQRK